MLTYDLIVIGFGKAGKTLAAKMAAQGKKVALIERSKAMYGGTCINIACIPTKTLLVAAEKGLAFDQVMAEKNAVTSRLNGKNYAAIRFLFTKIYIKRAFSAKFLIFIFLPAILPGLLLGISLFEGIKYIFTTFIIFIIKAFILFFFLTSVGFIGIIGKSSESVVNAVF